MGRFELSNSIRISLGEAPACVDYYSLYYEPGIQELCNRVKSMSLKDILKAAEALSPFIAKQAIIIPMPSSIGFPTYTWMMANHILARRKDCDIFDCLRMEPMPMSWKLMKEAGAKDFHQKVFCSASAGYLTDRPIVMLDNVYNTGTTFRKCKEAFLEKNHRLLAPEQEIRVLVIGYSPWLFR